MIVITVAAALVTYGWLMGYLGSTTERAGKGMLIQGVALDDNDLKIFVQNVGQGIITLNPNASVYINGVMSSASIDDGVLEEGETCTIIVPDQSTLQDQRVNVKVVSAEGTFMESMSVPTVVPDTTAPTVNNVLITPFSGPLGTVFTISADVSDPSGVQSVVAHIQNPDETDVDTVPLLDPDVDGTYTGTWDSFSFSGGSYVMDVIAIDTLLNAGEAENAETIKVTELISLLNENFEDWNAWDASPGTWYLSTDEDHTGRFSAKASNGQEGYFDCDPLDTRGGVAVLVDFWYRLSGGVDSGDFRVRFYDGSNWDQIVNLGNQGENTWRRYTYITTDPQYFISNFQLRFEATPDDSNERIFVDDVQIVKVTSATFYDGFDGSPWNDHWSGNWDDSTVHIRSSPNSAESRNGREGSFTSDTIDTRNSMGVYVDFWYYLDGGIDSGDFLFQLYRRSYQTIANLGGDPEDQWRHYQYFTTSSGYQRSNFRIRFSSSPDNSNEKVWIEDVRVILPKTAEVLFSDGFESWDDNWDASNHNWILGADQQRSGSYAAKSVNGYEGNFYCDALAASGAEAIHIEFWYRLSGGISGTDFRVSLRDNGGSYDEIANLSNQPEGSWQHFTYTTTSSQYAHNNLRLRFNSSPDDSNDNIWVDDVIIIMEAVP